MESEPTNAAAVAAREHFARMADLDFVDRVLPTMMASGYLREDRRRLVALPPEVDAVGVIEGLRVWHEMGNGAPSFNTKRTVAVRGERLAVVHHEIVLDDGTSTAFLLLVQLDSDCELTERVIQFDVDDEASAISALNKMHAEIDN